MRSQRSLAGRWQFQLDPEGTLRPDRLQPDRQISVPLPWQAAFPELQRYSGYAWYQRTFAVGEAELAGELLLHFGAVDYACQVYVNGELAGEHEGGYTPFALAIRSYVHSGENTLTVRVYDAVQSAVVIPRWRDQPAPSALPVAPEDMPHGKQTWYIDTSGIWQDVTLTAIPSAHIEHVRATTDIYTGEARFRIGLSGVLDGSTVSVTVEENQSAVTVRGRQQACNLSVRVPDVRLWAPNSPNLYTAVVRIDSEDEVRVRFGFREISTREGRLLLNGAPLMLLAALDQDFYPETIYTIPSEQYLRDEFGKAKALGFNCLRCHIKPPDPLYLDLADEMGLLVWAEVPSWRTFQPKTQIHPPKLDDALTERVQRTLEALVERDYNHPSLIIWTIVNEDWGTILPLSEADRHWAAKMVDWCKQLDPTRLAVDNSPCPAPWGLSTHVKTDINDFHLYTNIPERAQAFAEFIAQFSLRPRWMFSLQGDALPTGDEPLILSEFGNWGLPTLSELAPDGKEPAWFSLGPWWASWEGEPGFPQGVRGRFAQYGLDQIWGDYDRFAEATQWHQFAALKFEIETMRCSPTLAGYVVTELADAYWESNGLLDFHRNPKAYFEEFRHLNSADVIVAQLPRYVYWDDENVSATLHVSHYSADNWDGAQLHAALGADETMLPVPALARGEARLVGEFIGHPIHTAQSEQQVLEAEAVDGSGRVLAHSHTQILVLPSEFRSAAYSKPVYFVDSAAVEMTSPLADDLNRLGYAVYPQADARLCIADTVDADLLDWVAQGGDLLYLNSAGRNPFFWQQGRGGAYDGDWVTSFSWLRPGVYRRLPVSSPLTLPFAGIMPESVLLDLPVTNPAYHGDFLAGQITGWIGHPAIHTVQFRYGRGRVILTTYRLSDGLGYHPAAVAMLHDLVDHLVSDACQPALTLEP